MYCSKCHDIIDKKETQKILRRYKLAFKNLRKPLCEECVKSCFENSLSDYFVVKCRICDYYFDPCEVKEAIDQASEDYGGDMTYKDIVKREGHYICAECAAEQITYDDREGALDFIDRMTYRYNDDDIDESVSLDEASYYYLSDPDNLFDYPVEDMEKHLRDGY